MIVHDFAACNSVFCGNGKCVVNGTSYYCQCDQGYSNLFGKSTDACFEQCKLLFSLVMNYPRVK